MGDPAFNPEFYQVEEGDKTYVYVLMSVAIVFLLITIIKFA